MMIVYYEYIHFYQNNNVNYNACDINKPLNKIVSEFSKSYDLENHDYFF